MRIQTIGPILAALLLLAGVPPAAAEPRVNVRGVGELFLDGDGAVRGDNVAAVLGEGEAALRHVVASALGSELFSEVAIGGFARDGPIQGLGTSSLALVGSNAVVTLQDDVHAALRVATSSATTVRFELGPGLKARAADAGTAVDLVDETGAYVGGLAAVGADGDASKGETIAIMKGEVQVRAKAGTVLVFLAKPAQSGSDAFHRALVDAAAEGRLAATFVTELDGASVARSLLSTGAAATARVEATGTGVASWVRSASTASAMVAYDLAYETLPARSADEVSVYVDGHLAARASSAREVGAYAEHGLAAYYAAVHNGRSQVLASTPGFEGASEHRIEIAASAQASTSAQARAESGSDDGSRVHGGFERHENGKLTGEFLTGILADGKPVVYSFTSLSASAEVFERIALPDGAATHRHAGDHRYEVASPAADLTLVDDARATLLVDAKARADVALDLAAGVKATALSDRHVRLDGPNGYAGALLVLRSASDAASSLRVDGEARVVAALDPGARLVHRAHEEGEASEDVVAEAIADGRIGAQLLAGVHAGAVASSATSYWPGVVARVQAEARGALHVDLTPALRAKSFVLDSRGSALAAKAASDVRVVVDGKEAQLAASAAEALADTTTARYHAQTALDGSVRVLVNTAAAAGQTARVSIESRVDAAAKAAANTDAFGTFKLFYDGTAVGSFVTLKVDQQAGAVTDLTMITTGEPVFASLVAGASAFVSGGADGATTLVLENRESRIELSDTTSAFGKIVAKERTEATFRLAAGLTAELRAPDVLEITTSTGAHLGSLILSTVDGKRAEASRFSVAADGQARAHMEASAQVLFRTHAGIESELTSAERALINHAIAGGRVAGQVLVQTQAAVADASVSAQASAQASAGVAVGALQHAGQLTAAVTASYYADVQMATAATKDRVDVTITSATSVGKTIIVSLDPDTIRGMASGDAQILFDGHAAAQASSYEDVLDASDDGGAAEYFVLAGEAGTQVLVSIPHFSTHTVTLKQGDSEESSLFMYATILLGLVLVVETALLARRRKA